MSLIKEYKKPKILFIKGVFIRDCVKIDDMFEQQIIEQLDVEIPNIVYEKIPSIYNNDNWLKTNVKCWYCDLNFDNKPVFIPKIISKRKSNDYAIGTYGCFCSFSCSMSFINEKYSKICDRIMYKEMLELLFRIFYKKKVLEIYNSPSKYIMLQYGGNHTIIEYKNMIKQTLDKMIDESTCIETGEFKTS